MASGLRLAFFGLPLGAWLLARDGHDVALAVLSPVEGPPGRRRLVRQIGAERIVAATDAGFESTVDERLKRAPPDLVVSWFWTRKLPERWIAAGKLGAVGVHPSLLPRHRGPDPYFAAIDAGDETTGVTLHALTPEYDDGAILLTRELPVEERNAWQLARALDRPSLAVLREGVRRLGEGQPLPARAQDPALATWAPAPDGPLLRVTWAWPTARVLRRIRALSPVPGLALELAGTPLFITRAEAADEAPSALLPGEAAVDGDPPRRVLIRTGDGAIAVTAAVPADHDEAGGEVLDARDVAQLVASARAARS